jgi:ribosomal protein L37AE/L43A
LMVSVVAFRRHVGRRERRMLLQDLFRDVCPVCRRATTLSVIEPHLTRTGLDIYTFNCDRCGHTTSKVIETTLVARAQSLRSMVRRKVA